MIYTVAERGGFRDAWVCVLSRSGGGGARFDLRSAEVLPEWDVPHHFDMPTHLLDMLSEAGGAGSAEWRDLCRLRADLRARVPGKPPKRGDVLTVSCVDHPISFDDGMPRLLCTSANAHEVEMVLLDGAGDPGGQTFRLKPDMVRSVRRPRHEARPDRLDYLLAHSGKTLEAIHGNRKGPLDENALLWPACGAGVVVTAGEEIWWLDPIRADMTPWEVEIVARWQKKGFALVSLLSPDGRYSMDFVVGRSPDGEIVALGDTRAGPDCDAVRFAVEAWLARRPLVQGWDFPMSPSEPNSADGPDQEENFAPTPMN
ncbi:hypothetical protein [Jiella sp. M17.18]|uniref:hypothetical protein n=1 Tax=Jiella sp. M17.18 TaxID=3234247 RepID=UPI0034DEC14E